LPGATTIGVVCKDGVILAAERRVTYGYFVMSKSGKKVFKIAEKIGAACAGIVADMQILTREVGAYLNLYSYEREQSVTVRTAAKLMGSMLFERRYFIPRTNYRGWNGRSWAEAIRLRSIRLSDRG